MAAIYRRGKVWWGRVRREGREIRQSLKTTDRREAQRIFARWLADIERVRRGEKPDRTFDEAVELFLTSHMPSLRPSSQRRYAISIRHLLVDFGSKGIEGITSGALAEFEGRRRQAGASAPTIIRDFACLSSIFASALDQEWIEVNPVPAYTRRRAKRGLKTAAPRTRWLTHDEEKSLLSAALPSLRQAIILSIDTGLRREELLGLRWSQVDLVRGEIRLGKETKSGRPRAVPLLPRSKEILGTLPRHIRSEWVLHRNDYDATRYGDMSRGLKAAARRAKIRDLRWHDLRRTCGCRLLQDHGMSMTQVRDWLGHRSVVTTERSYAFLAVDDLHRAAQTRTITGTGDGA